MKTITRRNRIIDKAYFRWLCERIESRRILANDGDLLVYLHNLEFYSILPNDDNRVMDGIFLREYFEYETEFNRVSEKITNPCSLLEMLIALAERMDHILYMQELGSRVDKWFWLLIKNLKLKNFSHENADREKVLSWNDHIIENFLERNYESSGEGGLFPLNGNHGEDQRNIEIWYQMMAYIRKML